MEYKKGLMLILILVNIVLSGYLIYEDIIGTQGICLTGQGCKIVQHSQYSTLLGVKLSYIGFISFIVLLGIFNLAYKKKINYNIFLGISCVGALFSLYLLILQLFVINAICSTCLVIDVSSILIAILAILSRNKIH